VPPNFPEGQLIRQERDRLVHLSTWQVTMRSQKGKQRSREQGPERIASSSDAYSGCTGQEGASRKS
jgi:hypothetical protein